MTNEAALADHERTTPSDTQILTWINSSQPSGENADAVYLQWNEGWQIWEEVVVEAADMPGVVKFIRAPIAGE